MMTKKMKKKSVVEDSIGEELAKLDMKDRKDKKEASTAASKGKKAVSPDKGRGGCSLADGIIVSFSCP